MRRPRCGRVPLSLSPLPSPSRRPAAVLGMAPSDRATVWGVSSLHSGVPIGVLQTPAVSWAVQHRELCFRSSGTIPTVGGALPCPAVCVVVTVTGWKPGRCHCDVFGFQTLFSLPRTHASRRSTVPASPCQHPLLRWAQGCRDGRASPHSPQLSQLHKHAVSCAGQHDHRFSMETTDQKIRPQIKHFLVS